MDGWFGFGLVYGSVWFFVFVWFLKLSTPDQSNAQSYFIQGWKPHNHCYDLMAQICTVLKAKLNGLFTLLLGTCSNLVMNMDENIENPFIS